MELTVTAVDVMAPSKWGMGEQMDSKWINVFSWRRRKCLKQLPVTCFLDESLLLNVLIQNNLNYNMWRDSTKHQIYVIFWPISLCWKSGHWSGPSPERLLWEWRSISSVPIYTVHASIERQNEARFSQQSGQETKGFDDQDPTIKYSLFCYGAGFILLYIFYFYLLFYLF